MFRPPFVRPVRTQHFALPIAGRAGGSLRGLDGRIVEVGQRGPNLRTGGRTGQRESARTVPEVVLPLFHVAEEGLVQLEG